MATQLFRGQTVKGIANLRIVDQTTSAQKPYIIPGGATIIVKFPGSAGSVVLSSLTSGEVTIIDANAAQISYVMSAAKSLTLALNSKAAVDCIITDTLGNVDIFEAVKIYNIVDQMNP